MNLIIFNTVNRPQIMFKAIRHSLGNAGADFVVSARNNGGGKANDHLLWELAEIYPFAQLFSGPNIGNSYSLNTQLRAAEWMEWDYVAILGDDYEMPDNWLKDAISKMNEVRESGEEPGICGWNGWMEKKGTFDEELNIWRSDWMPGCWLFPREVFDKCGYFIAFTNYGSWDSEFSVRVARSGRVNFALENCTEAKHKGTDVGNKTEYRLMKDKHLREANRRKGLYVKRVPAAYRNHLSFLNCRWERVKELYADYLKLDE